MNKLISNKNYCERQILDGEEILLQIYHKIGFYEL